MADTCADDAVFDDSQHHFYMYFMCTIAVLDVYLSIMCVADKLTDSDPCAAVGSWDGTSYVKHW
jgi:hypothetical protein